MRIVDTSYGEVPTSDRQCCVYIANDLGADWFFANVDTEDMGHRFWQVYNYDGDFEEEDIKYWFYLPKVAIEVVGLVKEDEDE